MQNRQTRSSAAASASIEPALPSMRQPRTQPKNFPKEKSCKDLVPDNIDFGKENISINIPVHTAEVDEPSSPILKRSSNRKSTSARIQEEVEAMTIPVLPSSADIRRKLKEALATPEPQIPDTTTESHRMDTEITPEAQYEYENEYEEESTDHILIWSPPRETYGRHFSPPPLPMFDLEDDEDENNDDHPASKLTLEDLDLNEPGHRPSQSQSSNSHMDFNPDTENEMDEEDDKEDDPFGFSKVERRLQRTRNIRTKLLAINEQRQLKHNQTFANRTESSASSLSSRLGLGASRRSSMRKRGSTRVKPKTVDFTEQQSASSDNFKDVSDFDRYMEIEHTGLDSPKGQGDDQSGELDISIATTPPQRSWPRSHRYSMGLDLPPITLASTPKKTPEAGMPLAYKTTIPSTKARRTGSSVSKNIKYTTTEKLETLLPKRRRPQGNGVRTKVGRVPSSEDEIEEVESGSEHNNENYGRTSRRGNLGRRQTAADSKTAPPTFKKTMDLPTGDMRPYQSKSKAREPVPLEMTEESGWSVAQRRVQQERIQYFKEVDDFELEVETIR
ncbi:hypothetical protein CPC16_005466 [Podila verticillata]|nr:hypothetical protein CPC16_005466 [Podila verticillata]